MIFHYYIIITTTSGMQKENWYLKNNPFKIGINLLSSDNTYGQTVVEVRDKICSIFMMFG